MADHAELFKRYIWLVDLIYRHDGITRDEINRCWRESCYNNSKEHELPERTFHRYRKAIEELFEIEIVCDRHGEKTYHIAHPDALEKGGAREWLLNTFAVNNILSECKDLRHRILFEPIPIGQQYMIPIINAMRDGKVISLLYQSFRMDAPAPHEVEPYCLKIYKQRWYLLGRRLDRNVMRTFAFDRVKGIESTSKSFRIPDSFNAEKYFENTVGIAVEDDCPPQIIEFQAFNGTQDYIRSLPLHPSQQEYDTECNGAKFSILAQPNNDLIKEFLKFGADITVIRPAWFRSKLHDMVNQMSYNYNKE